MKYLITAKRDKYSLLWTLILYSKEKWWHLWNMDRYRLAGGLLPLAKWVKAYPCAKIKIYNKPKGIPIEVDK